MIIVVEEQLLAKALGGLEAKQIVADGIAAVAHIVLDLIRPRIEIAVGIGVEQQLVHLLAVALAADADLAGQIVPRRDNGQERAGRRRVGRCRGGIGVNQQLVIIWNRLSV